MKKKSSNFQEWIKSEESSALTGKEKTKKIANYWSKPSLSLKKKKSKSKPEIGLMYKARALDRKKKVL